MHNRWHVAEDREFSWFATVPPTAVAQLWQVVDRAGAEFDVYVTGPGGDVSALVAVAGPGGEIVERHVSDLGEVLAEAPYHADYLTYLKHRPPLEVSALGATLAIGSFSDLWLPWTVGWYEPDHEHGYRADNRPLANRHTPRLNEFLARVRAATLALGGEWERDWPEVPLDFDFQLTEHGVCLDAEDRRVREAQVTIDTGTLTTALREALRRLATKPPARPGYRTALQVYVTEQDHALHTRDRATLLAALRQVDVRAADLMAVEFIEIVSIAHGYVTFAVDEVLND